MAYVKRGNPRGKPRSTEVVPLPDKPKSQYSREEKRYYNRLMKRKSRDKIKAEKLGQTK